MKNSKQSFGHVNLSPELADQNQRTLEQVMIEIQEIINNTHWEETRLTQLKAKGYQIEHCWVKNGSIGVIWNMNGKKVFRIQVTESELHGKYYTKVLFIATANSLNTIQPALRDRMEIIEVNGYSLEEKIEIAKKHLIPKQKLEHGLLSKDVKFTNTAIKKVVEAYTRESGVRTLERKIGSLMRNIAKAKAMEQTFTSTLKPIDVRQILGPEVFDRDEYQENDEAGIAVGLAWTSVGGDILFIESNLSKGKGKITLSGQLGDVMKESAITALSYLKAHSEDVGIDNRIFENYDLHLHFPEGATPKDGPSAGITILTALASLYTQRKVKSKLAMTGEITLRGKVLPVGGIKEKILAAKRAGITEIIMCYKNEKDLEEINPDYIKNLKIHFVKTVDQVLEIALLNDSVNKPIKFIFDEKNKTE